MGEQTVHNLLLVVDCRIAESHSLKQKRSVIKGLTDKLRARFNASVAETGYLDEWQRAMIAISTVSNSTRYLQQQQARIEQHLLEIHDISIINIEQRWI